VAGQKIKKSDGVASIELAPTNDFSVTLGERKAPGQVLVGFAAETENLEANARAKLASKNLDLIVANDVTQEGAGFDTDTNIDTLIPARGMPWRFRRCPNERSRTPYGTGYSRFALGNGERWSTESADRGSRRPAVIAHCVCLSRLVASL
jgi:hypothetical protein